MLENREGQRVPETVFRARRDGDWHDVSSRELFAGRRVAVFALPGAFTPTCWVGFGRPESTRSSACPSTTASSWRPGAVTSTLRA